jgi:diguanylate cyclase (GGDEF)-like protein
MPPKLVTVDGEHVAVRIGERTFVYDAETNESVIPKDVLAGFRLSEMPPELIIKPVESVSGNEIVINDDIRLSAFGNGEASAFVEVMQRRKFWDSDIGLTPYIEAYRRVLVERQGAEESDFEDDGDYIFLHYTIPISEDLDIREAISRVENIIAEIEKRTDQLAHRRPDPLTDLFDRGSFDADLVHASQGAKTDAVSLLVIDLDKFKTVNDSYGHQAGDEVLKKVAAVLKSACEGNGSGYRYGGDEMVALLPRHSLNEALVVAEQIRAGIAGLKFEMSPENISASIGVASYPEVTKAVSDLFSDADEMVYQAKEDGGNAVRGAMASETKQDSARAIRLDTASRVDAVELWMRLSQGSGEHLSIFVTNDSDEDVSVEAVTLRKGKVYLSEPTKRSEKDDWTIRKYSSHTINWRAKTSPTHRLKLMGLAPGTLNEFDIVVWGRVLGRRKTFTHTILATYSDSLITEF